METFSALLAIGAGNSPVAGEFPAQRPVTWGSDIFFDLRLFTQQFIRAQIKENENIKVPRHWPLCGEFTGDRWIPSTNGQKTQKMFLFDAVIMGKYYE